MPNLSTENVCDSDVPCGRRRMLIDDCRGHASTTTTTTTTTTLMHLSFHAPARHPSKLLQAAAAPARGLDGGVPSGWLASQQRRRLSLPRGVRLRPRMAILLAKAIVSRRHGAVRRRRELRRAAAAGAAAAPAILGSRASGLCPGGVRRHHHPPRGSGTRTVHPCREPGR
jgi:hypothetical protein